MSEAHYRFYLDSAKTLRSNRLADPVGRYPMQRGAQVQLDRFDASRSRNRRVRSTATHPTQRHKDDYADYGLGLH
jgi:hypothetical protein